MKATYPATDPSVATFKDLRQLRRLLWIGLGLLAVVGILSSDSLDNLTAYLLVTVLSLLPTWLWLRLGAPGVPVFPVIAALHFPYFALPILRENFDRINVASAEILRAGGTASLFLAAATAVWWFIVRERTRHSLRARADHSSTAQVGRLICIGLGLGIVFQIALVAGWLDSLGGALGVVRAVALSAASVACYLVGYSRARRLLSGQTWGFVVAGFVFLIALAWSTLFLVAGMQFILAAILGFAITSKRVPWKLLLPVVAVIFVLHAGKGDMRYRYWNGGVGLNAPVSELPGLFTEWFGQGVEEIVTGQVQSDLFDRASLLHLLIYVQEMSPDYVPYLEGETYALLGSYLVPRFLDPDRTTTQAGLALLNMRYGLQTREDIQYTTIGWGMIPEAFANFGYIGVLAAGFAFGLLTAVFTCWSAGAPPLALSTLLSVAALVVMTNMEADFGFLVVSLWQTLAATLIAFLPLKFLGSSDGRLVAGRQLVASAGE